MALLTDDDEEVRRAAVDVLGRLEAGLLAGYAEALVARLTDDDEDVRWAAVEVLGRPWTESGVCVLWYAEPEVVATGVPLVPNTHQSCRASDTHVYLGRCAVTRATRAEFQ